MKVLLPFRLACTCSVTPLDSRNSSREPTCWGGHRHSYCLQSMAKGASVPLHVRVRWQPALNTIIYLAYEPYKKGILAHVQMGPRRGS